MEAISVASIFFTVQEKQACKDARLYYFYCLKTPERVY